MSYDPAADFLALLRNANGGVRTLRMPGLDFVVASLARAGLISLSVGQTAPTTNVGSTVWLKPAASAWASEGAIYLYNLATTAYEPANPVLWASLLLSSSLPPTLVQEVTAPGPADVLIGAGVVRVNQAVGAPITLVMPPAATKVGPVLISDWKGDAGTNNITVTLSGAEKFPGNLSSWVISGDTGSIFLRPVTGGYAL